MKSNSTKITNTSSNEMNSPPVKKTQILSMTTSPKMSSFDQKKDLFPSTKQKEFKPYVLKLDDDDPLSNDLGASNIANNFDLDKYISLEMKLRNPKVQLSTGFYSIIPFLVTLKVDEAISGYKAPIDLVCVIDHSKSMEGIKLQLVKDTFKYLINLLSEKDRVSIVVFNEKAHRLTPLLKLNDFNKTQMLYKLSVLKAEGNTNISNAMKIGLETLKQRRYINKVTSMFLLSDGLDTINGKETYPQIKALLQEYNLKSVYTINTFGYGTDHDLKLMTAIANMRQGTFYFIEKFEKIDECFVDCLGGLISIVGQEAKITINAEKTEALPYMKIEKAYGAKQTWTKISENVFLAQIPYLLSGKKKNYILELEIPRTDYKVDEKSRELMILTANLEVKGLPGAKSKLVKRTANANLILYNCEEEFKKNDFDNDRDVVFHYFRVRSAEVMNEARRLSDRKKYDKAIDLLKKFRNEIITCPYKFDVDFNSLIKDIDDAIIKVEPIVYENSGRYFMRQNILSYLEELSNLTTTVNYSNSVQLQMVSSARSRKKSQK